jgi:hypothetical protein
MQKTDLSFFKKFLIFLFNIPRELQSSYFVAITMFEKFQKQKSDEFFYLLVLRMTKTLLSLSYTIFYK